MGQGAAVAAQIGRTFQPLHIVHGLRAGLRHGDELALLLHHLLHLTAQRIHAGLQVGCLGCGQAFNGGVHPLKEPRVAQRGTGEIVDGVLFFRMGVGTVYEFRGKLDGGGRLQREDLVYSDVDLDDREYELPEVAFEFRGPMWLGARQLDLVHFDTAVNMGPGRAVRFLQKAAGCGVDGDFGSQTEKAVQACRPGDLIASYCATREAYYRELVRRNASLGVFLKGWLNRLNALRHEVGVPGFEALPRGWGEDAGGAERIPDIGEDPSYDF